MKHFITLNELEIKNTLPGATAAYFQTQYSTIAYTALAAGAEIPLHNHEQEAVDIIIQGKLEMQIGGTTSILERGMMSFVPSNVFHRAKAVTDCKVVTVLSPQRKD